MDRRKMTIERLLDRIQPLDTSWLTRAEQRQLQLTKPPGSLGRLEEIANRCAAIQRTLSPRVDSATILLFAADHGVCEESVSSYPQSVTARMVLNFLNGGAAINALAATCSIGLRVVDVGVAQDIPGRSRLIRRRIAQGTRNFCREPAMTGQQARSSVEVGIEMAESACREGCQLLGIGEMGIGNTTVAAALAAVLTGRAPARVVGRGTGADDACLARKIDAVERALNLHRQQIHGPLDLLARLGGLEIGAMCGVCLAGAALRRAVVIDGFIASAAAALALEWDSRVRDYLFAAHRSSEPGHAPLLERLGLRPLLDLQMRLGEGTGAALAIGLIRAALAAFNQMATFESAGVSGPECRLDSVSPPTP